MSGVATINLIPARRLQARRTVSRIAVWLWVIPVCCGMLGAAFVVQRFAGTMDGEALHAALDEVKLKIKESELRVAKQRREISEAGAVLRANRAVGEQPDWSALLALLTATLGNEAALTSLELTPVEASKTATVGAGGAVGAGWGRPDRLKLTIKGVALSQEAASRFVLDLEGSPFDRVTLVETQRVVEGAGEKEGSGGTVTFQVVCELSDPGASGVEGAPAGGASAAAGVAGGNDK